EPMTRHTSVLLVATFVAAIPWIWVTLAVAKASAATNQLCDPAADYFLGAENYSEAIRRHDEVLRKHPRNALAHYHLGFAYGMRGEKTQELLECERAVALGLSRWDLYLNMGLALLETGNPSAATNALRLAVRLGPDHPEPHFDLGLVCERRGVLAEAERELL